MGEIGCQQRLKRFSQCPEITKFAGPLTGKLSALTAAIVAQLHRCMRSRFDAEFAVTVQ